MQLHLHAVYEFMKLESFLTYRKVVLLNLVFTFVPTWSKIFDKQKKIISTGEFWVDPNEGVSEDAIKVYCDFSFNATCLYSSKEKKVFTNIIGHFQTFSFVSVSKLNKSVWNNSYEKSSAYRFIFVQIKLMRKVLRRDSFWNRGIG